MRIISANVNGLRSAISKGFYDWLANQDADFVCLQEIKASPEQLEAHPPPPDGYHCFYESGEHKGRHGVALFTRAEPDQVIYGFGSSEFDPEGRYLQVRVEDLTVASLYVPSGSNNNARREAKLRFLDEFRAHLAELAAVNGDCVVCGDFNIAHKEADIENPPNRKIPGFLPEERAWLDEVFGPIGFVDVFRRLNASSGNYTWFSKRNPSAREENAGWRIDYQAATPDLASRVRSVAIGTETLFSDHVPLVFDYE